MVEKAPTKAALKAHHCPEKANEDSLSFLTDKTILCAFKRAQEPLSSIVGCVQHPRNTTRKMELGFVVEANATTRPVSRLVSFSCTSLGLPAVLHVRSSCRHTPSCHKHWQWHWAKQPNEQHCVKQGSLSNLRGSQNKAALLLTLGVLFYDVVSFH